MAMLDAVEWRPVIDTSWNTLYWTDHNGRVKESVYMVTPRSDRVSARRALLGLQAAGLVEVRGTYEARLIGS